MGFDVGGGSSRTNTDFRRVGNSTTRQHANRPGWLSSANRGLIEGSLISPEVRGADMAALFELLTKDMNALPNGLEGIASMPDTGFGGETALRSIASIDPYSDRYREQTEDFFTNLFAEASATARTGPDAIRGGHAHGAMVESNVLEKAALNKFREITGLQLGQADMTTRAAQMLNAIQSGRRGEAMGAHSVGVDEVLRGLGLQLGASDEISKRLGIGAQTNAALSKEFGTEVGITNDNLSGRGVQNSSHDNWNTGLNLCCFIFLEALNGELPWFVRRARDLMCTPQKVAGYRRMSRWLVPAMRKSRLVSATINVVMVKRFLAYGAYLFNAEGASKIRGLANKPICEFWFAVWHILGRKTKSYAELR